MRLGDGGSILGEGISSFVLGEVEIPIDCEPNVLLFTLDNRSEKMLGGV